MSSWRAWHCGLPAIAVDRLGPAEIVDDGHTGWLVEPDDVKQLSDTIVAVLDDDCERLRRRRRARITAGARWGWAALAERMACASARSRSGCAHAVASLKQRF